MTLRLASLNHLKCKPGEGNYPAISKLNSGRYQVGNVDSRLSAAMRCSQRLTHGRGRKWTYSGRITTTTDETLETTVEVIEEIVVNITGKYGSSLSPQNRQVLIGMFISWAILHTCSVISIKAFFIS